MNGLTHDTDRADRPATERVLLFDMDGIILEGRGTDEVVHEQALDDAIADRGLTVEPDIRALLEGYEYDTEFALGCKRLGIDPVELFGLREQYGARRTIDRLKAGKRGLYPDVDAFAELADSHPLGIVSNNYHSVVEFVVDHHDIAEFAHVRGRDAGVRGFYRRKPDPHYLLEATTALGTTNAVYVGDRVTDVVAATRAGLDAVFVRRSHNTETTVPGEALAEVDSLNALVERF